MVTCIDQGLFQQALGKEKLIQVACQVVAHSRQGIAGIFKSIDASFFQQFFGLIT